MLNPVPLTRDRVPVALASLAERDEFGAITGPLGLFSSPIAPVVLDELDELGRPLHVWAPDGDLL
jgi:hypothetical protein